MHTQYILYTQIKRYLAFLVIGLFCASQSFAVSTCKAGFYLDLENDECVECYTRAFYKKFHGFVCPGMDTNPVGTDQRGLLACDDNTVPDEKQNVCTRMRGELINLKPGYYYDGKEVLVCYEQNMNKIYNQYKSEGSTKHYIAANPVNNIDKNKDFGYNFYCPGGDFRVDDYPKGFRFCPDGTDYSSANGYYYSFCESSFPVYQVTCKSGEFVPANARSCQSCSIIHNGLWDKQITGGNTSREQSCINSFTASVPVAGAQFADNKKLKNVCPSGAQFNENNSKCLNENGEEIVPTTANNSNQNNNATSLTSQFNILNTNLSSAKLLTSVKCGKGEVWFNQQCTPCTSNIAWKNYAQENRFYCPGGEWGIETTVLTQLKKCPRGSWPNDDLTGCDCRWGEKDIKKCTLQEKTSEQCECTNITLNFEDLYYGPKGKNAPLHKQCWTKTTDAAYKTCMGFDN